MAGSFSESTERIQQDASRQIGVFTGLIGSVTAVIAVFTTFAAVGKRVSETFIEMNESGSSLANETISGIATSATTLTEQAAALRAELQELDKQLINRDAGLPGESQIRALLSGKTTQALRDEEEAVRARLQAVSELIQAERQRGREGEAAAAQEAADNARRDRIRSIAAELAAVLDAEREALRSPTERAERQLIEARNTLSRLRGDIDEGLRQALLDGYEEVFARQMDAIREQEDVRDRASADRLRREREQAIANAKAAAEAYGRELERSIGTALNFNLNGAANSLTQLVGQLEVIAQNGSRI